VKCKVCDAEENRDKIRRLRQDYDDAVKTLNRARERLDQIVEELEELGAVP